LIDADSAFVALADAQGCVVFLNRAARKAAGLSQHDRTTLAALIPELPPAAGMWRGEGTLMNPSSGIGIPVEVQQFPVAGGHRTGVIARDISQRKAAEQRLHAVTAQLLRAQEEERRRLARALHDDLIQEVTALRIEIGMIRKRACRAVEPDLETLQEKLDNLTGDIRLLSHGLHPSVLEYCGLGAALEAHCREVAAQTQLHIACQRRDLPERIPDAVAIAIYRSAQEALRNVVRHAGASSVFVLLAGEPAGIRLSVVDDGRGFNVDEVRRAGGIGLASIEERARLVDGHVLIVSEPGEGTRIDIHMPMAVTPAE
jgi:signal transduction histidine kinase